MKCRDNLIRSGEIRAQKGLRRTPPSSACSIGAENQFKNLSCGAKGKTTLSFLIVLLNRQLFRRTVRAVDFHKMKTPFPFVWALRSPLYNPDATPAPNQSITAGVLTEL